MCLEEGKKKKTKRKENQEINMENQISHFQMKLMKPHVFFMLYISMNNNAIQLF